MSSINRNEITCPGLFKSWLFWIPFIWAIFCGMLLQFVIFPHFFSQTYWGHGLIQGDWVEFHLKAVEFANSSSFSRLNFSVIPLEYAPAYPLGVLYFLFKIQEPWIMLPLNAFVFGASVFMLYLVCLKLGFSKKSSLCSLALLFLFPSSLELFGLVHRDGFVFLGYLMILYFLISWFLKVEKKFVRSIFVLLGGLILTGFFRPYLLNLLAIIFGTIFLYILVMGSKQLKYRSLIIIPICLLCLNFGKRDPRFNGIKSLHAGTQITESENSFDKMFPLFIRKQFNGIAEFRRIAHVQSPSAGSSVYQDLEVGTPTKFILAIPTLFKVAVIEPIPFLLQKETKWSIMDKVAFGESIVSLFLLAVLLVGAVKGRRSDFFVIIYVTFVCLLLGALVGVNLGSVYRFRLGYVIMLSALGLATLVEGLKRKKSGV